MMNYNSFHKLLKNKYALSTVVTTLIILVISVLLASVVTYFAINVVSTRVQEESLALTATHIWLNPAAHPGEPTYSMASVMVINTGGRDVVINKVAVRGQDCAWASTGQFIVYSITNEPVQTDMYFQTSMATGTFPTTQSFLLNPDDSSGKSYDFDYSTTNLVLRSGYTMLIYVINPDSITINDIGLTVSVTLYTAQAMYYREANVQAYAPVAAGSS
jgi:hypothetical protein